MPSEVSLTNGNANVNVGANGVPTISYFSPITTTIFGPTYINSTLEWEFTVNGVVVSQSAAPVPSDATGKFVFTIPTLYPAHGNGNLSYTITPLSGSPVTTDFDVYVDPSGIIVDKYGTPINGAVVTLLHKDIASGKFVAVPAGSTIMSTNNRANPYTTTSDGRFSWDVAQGVYKIKASYKGVEFTTDAMPVSPERVGLVLKLDTKFAEPLSGVGANVTGEAVVGKSLVADAGIFPDVTPDRYDAGTYDWYVGGVLQANHAAKLSITKAMAGKTITVDANITKVVKGFLNGIAKNEADKDIAIFEFKFPYKKAIAYSEVVSEVNALSELPDNTKGVTELVVKEKVSNSVAKTAASKNILKKTAIAKVVAGKKLIIVTWKKVPKAQKIAKYQIRYKEKSAKKWTTKSVSAKSANLTINKLKKGKVYRVQVRSYKTVGGVKYYSAWSAVKSSCKVK
jgi:hypothetical protein